MGKAPESLGDPVSSSWEGKGEDDGGGENLHFNQAPQGVLKPMACGPHLVAYWFRQDKMEEGIVQGVRESSRMNRTLEVGAGVVCASKSKGSRLGLAGIRNADGGSGEK